MRQYHTTLTLHELIRVSVFSIKSQVLKTHLFLIQDLGGFPGVTVIETDLSVDILPKSEGMAENAVLQKFFTPSDPASKAQSLKWVNEPSSSPLSSVSISLTHQRIEKDSCLYYSFPVRPNIFYSIHVLTPNGDVNLFAARETQTPSLQNHNFYSVNSKDHQILFQGIQGKDTMYLMIQGYDNLNSEFDLTLAQSNTPFPSPISFQSPMDFSQPTLDDQRCSNCYSWISKSNLNRHESFCLRNNILCDLCGKVFEKSTFQDHIHCSELDCRMVRTFPSLPFLM